MTSIEDLTKKMSVEKIGQLVEKEERWQRKKSRIKEGLGKSVTSIALYLAWVGTTMWYIDNRNEEISQNTDIIYAIPEKTEIVSKKYSDSENAKYYTVLKYDTTEYLLMVDSLGKPQLKEYTLKPAEIKVKP